MRLITSQTEIDNILHEAIVQFMEGLQNGQVVATNNEWCSPFWRETMYDLVRLAIASYPIALKFLDSSEKYHCALGTRHLSLWQQTEPDFESLIMRGLSSPSPEHFVLFALEPYAVYSAHCCLYEQLDEPICRAPFPPAPEWFDALAIADHHLLIGENTSNKQRNKKLWESIITCHPS